MPFAAAPPTGLRARNRLRTRDEIARVALSLFTERGFAAVTVDDIATAADISRRTFFRYFESKEDAVLPYEDERLDQLRAALAERPRDEPILVSIRHATTTIVSDVAAGPKLRADALRRLRIVHENPSVHARSLELQSRLEGALRETIADRLGEQAGDSLAAHVAAAGAIAAFRSAVAVWFDRDATAPLAALIEEAYDLLTAGLGPADGTS